MEKSPYLTVYRALVQVFPDVHFQVQSEKKRDANKALKDDKNATVFTVSYDPVELEASKEKGDILEIVNETLDKFYKARGKDNRFTIVRLYAVESFKTAQDRLIREFVEGFKSLVESNADYDKLAEYARENSFKLPSVGPFASAG